MLAIGELTELVELQSAARSRSDLDGSLVEKWTTYATIWVKITRISAGESGDESGLRAERRWLVETLRLWQPVSPNDRLIWGGRDLYITALDDSGDDLALECAETIPAVEPLEAPAAPSAPDPPDGATDVSMFPTLAWAHALRAVWYEIQFGTESPPPLVATVGSRQWEPGELEPETIYYWRIIARNGAESTAGPIWRFTTEVFVGNP